MFHCVARLVVRRPSPVACPDPRFALWLRSQRKKCSTLRGLPRIGLPNRSTRCGGAGSCRAFHEVRAVQNVCLRTDLLWHDTSKRAGKDFLPL